MHVPYTMISSMIAKLAKDNQPSCEQFLYCPTPQRWINAAIEALPTVLIDHAHCELKAAHTAMALIRRYPQYPALCQQLSRLAREELRHFEQVMRLLPDYGATFSHLSAANYASGLMAKVATQEPAKLVETLMVAAIIEARSCERFMALVPHLPTQLSDFYQRLVDSERRHYLIYLSHAKTLGEQTSIEYPFAARLDSLLSEEKTLIEGKDDKLRFHSGVPLQN